MANKSLQVQSVLYHNEKEGLLKALEALNRAVEIDRENTGELSTVTVRYGDASRENIFTGTEIDALNKKFEGQIQIQYEFFNENTGTAKGHNRMGRDCTADFMLIMNPDVLVCPRFFEYMFAPFNKEGSCAGLTEGRQTPVEHPKEYNKKTFETDWAATACALFPTEIFNQINGFDEESFFMYCDDLDFSWRIRLAGKKIYYCPDAVVFHAKTLSNKGGWTPTNAEVYYSAEAAILMAHKWSNDKRVKMLLKTFSQSGEETLRKAAAHFEELKAQGKLPKQIDKQHKVAKFIGDNYTQHRFVL